MNLKRIHAAMAGTMMLAGCAVVPSGNYEITAVDASGKPVATHMRLTAEGTGVYRARNAMCIAHPGAVVTIKSQTTGKQLEGASPYRCR